MDQIGFDRRGPDRVYGDAKLREFTRQNLGEGNHCGFGGRIDCFTFQFQRDRDADEIDDPPVPMKLHQSRSFTAEEKRAGEIRFHDFVHCCDGVRSE